VIDLEGAPADQVALAYTNRGLAWGESGKTDAAIRACADLTSALAVERVPAGRASKALLLRAKYKFEALRDRAGAIEDCLTAIDKGGSEQIGNEARNYLAALRRSN
jgi:hypothetical protein